MEFGVKITAHIHTVELNFLTSGSLDDPSWAPYTYFPTYAQLLTEYNRAEFKPVFMTAVILAMAFNFFVNNLLTYWDQRLKGLRQLLIGLLSFSAVCSLGAVANVGIANYVFTSNYSWWLAGLAGVLVGAVWNYAASSVFTWRISK